MNSKLTRLYVSHNRFTFEIIQTVCYFKKLNGQREAIDAKPADETIAY